MPDEQRTDQDAKEPKERKERIERPEHEVKDLDVPPEESENVQGGVRKAGEKPLEY